MTEPTPELLAACDEIAEHVASMLAQGKLLNIRDFTNTQNIAYGIMKQEFSRGVAAFVQAREQAAAQRAIEEHEAELCPEDYGCEEYIAYLKKRERVARLDEAKWWHGRKGTCPSATSDECCRRIAALAEPKEPQ